jgi:O-antigen/teichoic acid export membrane protein
MGIGFGVGIVLARVYGPEDYGHLNYVIAMASVFGCLASLGFDDLLPRDLASPDLKVARRDAEKTAVFLRLFAETLAYAGLLLFFGLRQGSDVIFGFAALYGTYFLLQATDVIEFGRRVDGDFAGIARLRLGASLVSGLLKLIIAALKLPFLWISGAMVVEFLIATLYYLRRIIKNPALKGGEFRRDYAGSLLQRAAPLVLAGALGILQTRMDSLLIEETLGAGRLGVYAAALRMVELLDALGIVLSILLVPEFGRRKGAALERWARAAYLAGTLLFLMALPALFLLWQAFPWVYGPKFIEGQSVMLWLFPRPFFYLLGMIRVGLLLSEQHYRRIPLYSAFSVTLTSLLFQPLTQNFGLEGAAMAGTLGIALSGLGLDLLVYPRNLRRMILAPMALPDLMRALRSHRKATGPRSGDALRHDNGN